MKSNRNLSVILVLVLFVALISSNISVYAAEVEAWDQWQMKNTTNPMKEWTVKFNLEIDDKTVNGDNIYVTDDDEMLVTGIVPILENDKRTVKVTLKEQYKAGETYNLYITSRVKSIKGESLKRGIKMPFNIETIDDEDWIYYINKLPDYDTSNSEEYEYLGDRDDYRRIYRIKSDGSEKVKLTDDMAYKIKVVGNWIYYMKIDYLEREEGMVQRGTLYKVKTDGTEKQKVLTKTITNFSVDEEWIYYGEHEVFRVKHDGTDLEKIIEGKSFSYDVDEEWIYYENSLDENHIYKSHLDGTGKTKISNSSANYELGFYLDVKNDIMLFQSMDNDWEYGTNILNIITGKEIKLEYKGYIKLVDVTDGWINFIQTTPNKVYKYKMRKDGNGLTKSWEVFQ